MYCNMFEYAAFIMYVKQVPQVQSGWEYKLYYTYVDSFYRRHDNIMSIAAWKMEWIFATIFFLEWLKQKMSAKTLSLKSSF